MYTHSYRFPLELVSSVFDLVFAEGVEAVFRFAIALLKRSEPYLLTLEFEDLIDFLKNGLFEVYAVRVAPPAYWPSARLRRLTICFLRTRQLSPMRRSSSGIRRRSTRYTSSSARRCRSG